MVATLMAAVEFNLTSEYSYYPFNVQVLLQVLHLKVQLQPPISVFQVMVRVTAQVKYFAILKQLLELIEEHPSYLQLTSSFLLLDSAFLRHLEFVRCPENSNELLDPR